MHDWINVYLDILTTLLFQIIEAFL